MVITNWYKQIFWTNFWGNNYLTFQVRVLLMGTLTNGNPYLKGKGFEGWDIVVKKLNIKHALARQAKQTGSHLARLPSDQ